MWRRETRRDPAGSACRVCIHILYIIVKWESNNKGFAITWSALCARWNITQAIVGPAPADPTFEMVSRPLRLPAPFDLGEGDLTTSVEWGGGVGVGEESGHAANLAPSSWPLNRSGICFIIWMSRLCEITTKLIAFRSFFFSFPPCTMAVISSLYCAHFYIPDWVASHHQLSKKVYW